MDSHRVFITGGTGYMGRSLIPELLRRRHEVRALVREQSRSKLPKGCTAILGNALDHTSYSNHIPPADTFVHLVGVPHPSPSKAEQFRQIDLVAAREAIAAACSAPVQHFIYLSVAHPAPVMKAYIEVRTACEQMIRESRMNATILRPWYVLGPRHRWPYALLPVYWLLERIPGTRDGARRLGLVSLAQMIRALVHAIEKPVHGIRVLGVPEMRKVPSALQESIAGAR